MLVFRNTVYKAEIDKSGYNEYSLSRENPAGFVKKVFPAITDREIDTLNLMYFLKEYNDREEKLRYALILEICELPMTLDKLKEFLNLRMSGSRLSINNSYCDILNISLEKEYSIGELIKGSDKTFIHRMYTWVLKRLPDEEGLKFNLAKINDVGINRLDVLIDFYSSEERLLNQSDLVIRNIRVVKFMKRVGLVRLYRSLDQSNMTYLTRPFVGIIHKIYS